MPTIVVNLTTTAVAMASGVDPVAGKSATWEITVAPTWVAEETYSYRFLLNATNYTYNLGYGYASGKSPTFCMTFKDKMYLVDSDTLLFSAVGDCEVYNDLNAAGPGFITVSNHVALPENIVSLAPYQGKMALLGRYLSQIWTMDADPANNTQGQVLLNIGTMAADSAKAVGNLDVLFLHDSGVRSLRVRDSSNNATIVDVGSPIDALIAAKLATCTDQEKADACAVVEPNVNRYWLWLKDTLYVLSYFESVGVSAWSTYTFNEVGDSIPSSEQNGNEFTWNGVDIESWYVWQPQTAGDSIEAVRLIGDEIDGISVVADASITPIRFKPANTNFLITRNGGSGAYTGTIKQEIAHSPYKFVVYQGKVYGRATEELLLYGGNEGTTYDDSIASWETPWLDNKQPATRKLARAVDAKQNDTWNILVGTDFVSGTLSNVYTPTEGPASMEGGSVPFHSQGTHFKFRGVTTAAERATISSIILHFKNADAR